MPVKRSRIGRSTSMGDTDVMPPPSTRRGADASKLPAVGNSAKAIKASAEEERSGEKRLGILSVSSPVKQSEEAASSVGFLKRCYGCKKELREGADVFMYSYLRAFCSDECRKRQICIDNVAEVVSPASNVHTT